MNGEAGGQLVDWVTVAAQLINFIILVVLLKYLLFDRIVRAMDERQRKIQSKLDDANAKDQEANEALEKYQGKKDEIDRKGEELLNTAKREADKEREKLVKQARENVREQKQRWQRGVQADASQFLADLRSRTAQQVCLVSKRILNDLADAELEDQVVKKFLRQLDAIEDDERQTFTQAVERADDKVTIHTSFEVSDTRREELLKGLDGLLSNEKEVVFAHDDNLVCGIEVRSGGQAIGWSIEAYVDSLVEDVSGSMEESEQRESRETKAEEKEAR